MPQGTTYSDFSRGNKFGPKNMNNSFQQGLYLTQEILDGYLPEGSTQKQDLNFGGGHAPTNLRAPVVPSDATNKEYVDARDTEQRDRLTSLETAHIVSSANDMISYTYHGGSALGGELTFSVGIPFVSVNRLYINGVHQTYGLAWDYDNSLQIVELAEELDTGDEVVVELGVDAQKILDNEVVSSNATVVSDVTNQPIRLGTIAMNSVPIKTIADLRTYSPVADGQVVDVLGHTLAGIGGGQFYYDPEDSTSADNNGTVIVTSSWERWKASNLTQSIVYSVGSGGDFDTINEAIKRLSNKRQYDPDTRVTLTLEAGFVMYEQLFVDSADLSWFSIESVDSEVVIDRASLTETYPNLDFNSTPAFLAVNGGQLPLINCQFNMNTTGTADNLKQHGIMVAWRGGVTVGQNSGVKNATGRGLYGVHGFAYARNSNFSGAGTYGCRAGNGSVFNIRDSDFSGAGLAGLYTAISTVSAVNADFSGSALVAVRSIQGSLITLTDANLQNATQYALLMEGGVVQGDGMNFSGYGDRGIQATSGVFIGSGTTCTSGTGRAVNTVSGAEVRIPNSTITGIVNANLFVASSGSSIVATSCTTSKTIAGADFVSFSGAEILSNGTTGEYSKTPNVINSSGVIRANVVTSSRGLATILNTTSSIVVTHGLGVTPSTSDISISPINGEAASSAWRVGSANSTDFTLSVNSSVTSDAGYAWRVDVI